VGRRGRFPDVDGFGLPDDASWKPPFHGAADLRGQAGGNYLHLDLQYFARGRDLHGMLHALRPVFGLIDRRCGPGRLAQLGDGVPAGDAPDRVADRSRQVHEGDPLLVHRLLLTRLVPRDRRRGGAQNTRPRGPEKRRRRHEPHGWSESGYGEADTPGIEVAVDELEDLGRVRIDLQEEADARGVVLAGHDARLEQRDVAGYDAVAGGEKVRERLRNELVELGIVAERVARGEDRRHVLGVGQ